MPKRATGRRAYVGIEPGLREANKKYLISCDKRLTHKTTSLVEQVVKKIIQAMKAESPAFGRLYAKNFGGGSIYDGLKIGKPDEFDIDILLKLPEVAQPVLVEDNVAGFAQIKLQNFEKLAKVDREMHSLIGRFIDEDCYLLPMKMKSVFQSIFDKTLSKRFPNDVVKIGRRKTSPKYKISRVQHLGPAFTLTLNGLLLDEVEVSVDLVPSILLSTNFWPRPPCRENPYSTFSEFFLTPTTPKQDHLHQKRFWRLSFHMQERKIIFHQMYLKPTIKIFKRIRDHFGHNIKSYDIKTVFLWEIFNQNPSLDGSNSDLWKAQPSFIMVYMMEKYLSFLKSKHIPDFWNEKLDLLCHISDLELEKYAKNISMVLDHIKKNPTPKTLMKYLL